MQPARLVISRSAERDLKIRGIEVLLDGRFLGDLHFGREIDVQIDPGEHQLKVTNRLSSRTADFEAGPDETIRFGATGLALGGIWFLMTMLGTVAYRVELERLPSP